ncbi:MAG: hypothetical protein WC071_05950, partial [Victivallaceae bacterium]
MKKMMQGVTTLAVMLTAILTNAMPSYDDVLLIINTKSPESQEIGSYFKAARHIPDANVCNISVTPALGTGTRMANDEKWVALDTIKKHLINNNLTDKINYIVLTHGTPKYAYTGKKGKNYGGDEIDLYHLFDVFLMYQLSESAADTSIPNIFTNNKYYYYNNVPTFKLYADSIPGEKYVDVVPDPSLSYAQVGDVVFLTDASKGANNAYNGTIAGVEEFPGFVRLTFAVTVLNQFTAAYGLVGISSDSFPKLTKKFSRNKFGYYIVGRLDGPGTTTVKSMIDNTGYPATQSYKQPANGKMKLLTLTPYYSSMTIDEINKRENIEVVSPNPIPPDVWDPVTQHTTMFNNTDSTITLENTFDKVGKDVMFCFLNDVSWDSFFQWPQGNSYYADGDFVEDYPFIYRGATFLPGSIMMIYRSNPAAYDSHGGNGGVYKMNLVSKAKTSFVKLDASDMKFRDMTCVEYDPVNNLVWAGTGKNQLDVGMNFNQRCTDDAHRETMRNYGGGIVIYDPSGNILNWINANDADSPLKNNRVTQMVYDKNSKYMWVAHYKGIQYYDLSTETWHDIPELQNDYTSQPSIYLDSFDSDKVYFSFHYDAASANTKKVSSQIVGADTSIFEYSKSAKTV